MPVCELLERVDSAELTRWMAYEKVRPPERSEEDLAQLLHWLGVLWLKKPVALSKFLPTRHLDPDRAMSPAEIRAALRGL